LPHATRRLSISRERKPFFWQLRLELIAGGATTALSGTDGSA